MCELCNQSQFIEIFPALIDFELLVSQSVEMLWKVSIFLLPFCILVVSSLERLEKNVEDLNSITNARQQKCAY